MTAKWRITCSKCTVKPRFRSKFENHRTQRPHRNHTENHTKSAPEGALFGVSVLHLFRRHTRHPARHKGVLKPRSTPNKITFCQGIAPKIFACEGVTPSRSLWGYYTPTPPHYCSVSSPCARFVKELRRKISRATPAKIFAPLTPTENSIINTRAERSPAPRLNCKKTHPVYCLNLFF